MSEPSSLAHQESQSAHYQNAWLIGFVLLFVGMSCACIMYKPSTIMVPLGARFGLSASGSTLLMSIFTFVGIFIAIPAGNLIRRFGFKRILLGSIVLMVVGSVLGMFAGGSGAVLIGSRAVEGIGTVCLCAAAPVAVQECVEPRKVGLATGFWGCWAPSGSIVSSLLTPVLFSSMGFVSVWAVYAVFSAISFVLVLLLIKQPPLRPLERDGAPAVGYRACVTRDTVTYLVAFFFIGVMLVSISGLLPTVLQARGLSIAQSGIVVTVIYVLTLVSSPIFGSIADKIGKTKPLLPICSIGMALGVFLVFSQNGALLWVGVALIGLIGSGACGIFISGLMLVVPGPEYAAPAMGLLMLAQQLANFVATAAVPMLLGPSFDRFLLTASVLACCCIVQFVLLLLVRMRDHG